ncbi:uncharacterized protein, partial [Channa argus]|uniref:uncharacterized protein n=1 Tax=Channa argus TaxID=215402 RepID=UPI00351F89A8
MKTPSNSLLLGVSVLLLLCGLTVSAVYLNVSPNLQQFFTRGPPVSLSCVGEGQTVDGWTVKRTREGQTEQCGADNQDFEVSSSSTCVLSLTTTFIEVYLCETSLGKRSNQVTITVTDKDLILEIPALPVMTGSNVTLHCRNKNSGIVTAYFYKNETCTDLKSEHIISKVQQSDEGFYSCATDKSGKSPQSWLRVRDPPTTSDSHTTTSSGSSGADITTSYTAVAFINTDPPALFSLPPSLLIPVAVVA